MGVLINNLWNFVSTWLFRFFKSMLSLFFCQLIQEMEASTLCPVLCQKLLSQPGKKSTEQREEAAIACELYTKRFPVLFKRDMTRKMHVFSNVLPKQIREKGEYYEYLKLEQEEESLYHQLNELEIQFACVKNQALRYFLMIKELANRKNCNKSLFTKKKRVLRNKITPIFFRNLITWLNWVCTI